MAKILALAGSNSSTSINYKLVRYTTSLIENHEVALLDMANYPFKMYNEDTEKKEGYSNSLVELKNDIYHSKGIILSVNEHNGSISAYFKNVLDWLSRLERKFMENSKVLAMSTSPGKRGGIGAMEYINGVLPRFGAEMVSTYSLPSFHENFDVDRGIVNTDLAKAHREALDTFLNSF